MADNQTLLYKDKFRNSSNIAPVTNSLQRPLNDIFKTVFLPNYLFKYSFTMLCFYAKTICYVPEKGRNSRNESSKTETGSKNVIGKDVIHLPSFNFYNKFWHKLLYCHSQDTVSHGMQLLRLPHSIWSFQLNSLCLSAVYLLRRFSIGDIFK